MNMDTIGYRYTRDELEALRLILDLPVPIGINPVKLDRERYDRAMESLRTSGLIIGTDEHVYIDPVIMLLLQEASASTSCLRIRSANRHTILHQAPRMYLMNDCTVSTCTLTPLQHAQHINSPMTSALTQHESPIILEFFSENAMQSVEAISYEEANTALQDMLTKIRMRPAN